MRNGNGQFGTESIELLAICADLATILLASIVSAWLFRIDSSWIAADLGKAVGSAIIASALFVSLLKMRGTYRPTELLVLRNQMRAVCLAWTLHIFSARRRCWRAQHWPRTLP